MSKYMKAIPLDQIERVQIYVNQNKKTLAQIKAETGADFLINGGLFEGARAVCPLRADGYTWGEDPFNYFGYAWDRGPDIRMEVVPNEARSNYIACVALLRDKQPQKLIYNPDVGGSRQRTAMGLMGDKLCLYCTDGGVTPEALRCELASLGWDSALMLDGGGSSQCDFQGARVTSSRKVHNLILVYLKKGGGKPPEEDCMDCTEKLVKVAMGELGTSAPTGDDKYISWYNKIMGEKLPLSVSWCAIFVSWCARQAGVCAGAIPNYASCTAAVSTFKKLGIWKPRGSYTPKRGDLIFFDWDRDPGVSEHTGIVTGVENGYVQTIEGNSGTPGAVRVKSYALNSVLVLGYAAWAGTAVVDAPENNPVKTAQAALNERYKAGLTVDGAWGPASQKAAIRAAQTEINAVYKKSLAVDGSWGPACKAACPTLRQGDVNNLVWVLQLLLTAKGHEVDRDRSYGPGTTAAVKAFQGEKNLNVDGMAGSGTFTALLA